MILAHLKCAPVLFYLYEKHNKIKMEKIGYVFVQGGCSLLEKGGLVSSRSPFELRWHLNGFRS